ncbi:MAG TPA: Fic family protein [Buttiauxella sp.]|uniref:Fic family protein n=1 Tax=Buttiauxella sp. TaxID=1972222 RepID=UPI002B45B4F3|nr:Fic family protein [Buttiauxella sp.]HKM96995.1 Fic family protein [Buttiauxella sp.]
MKQPSAIMPLSSLTGAQLEAHQQYNRILDDKGRYLPFDEFRHRVKRGDDPELAWTLTRHARSASLQFINYHNELGERAGFNITPLVSETCELVDKHATQTALREYLQQLPAGGAELSQLQLDESITSSQLEGANTTTLVARNMLETGRKPRTEDEHMIAGNARLMTAIPEHLAEPLSIELLRHFHAAGMSGINDAKYHPGNFRETDDVVIADYDGNIVHQPPVAASIPDRLQAVCDFANDLTGQYIHPLIRACLLHFMLAHEHPFRDGNGRTSRALFYWYMLKHGYDAFRYVSISQPLHAAPVKYAHSYQHTEHDGMDVTYFLEHQASILKRAVTKYLDFIHETIHRRAAVDHLLAGSGALSRLLPRQIALLNIMLAEPQKHFTAAEVSQIMGISDGTARSALRVLVREGLAMEIQVNNQQTAYTAVKLR